MKPSIAKIRGFFDRSHRDESGAVALLCLAAVLALMMVAWIIVDAHKSTKDKIMLQGAADTAAFSHASVEARSMNMIAYSNISKRSIVGIHSLYPSFFAAYTVWLAGKVADCLKIPPNLGACATAIYNAPTWISEFIGDHVKYSGDPITPYIEAAAEGLTDIVGTISGLKDGLDELGFGIDLSPLGSGNSENAHLSDIRALDNYQHYMLHITPWWAFTEHLSRGWRNGASAVASFPPPPGRVTIGLSAIQNVIDKINTALSLFGIQTIDLTTFHGNDNLPISKASWGSGFLSPPPAVNWMCQMVTGYSNCGLSLDSLGSYSLSSLKSMGNESYIVEHIANTIRHKQESGVDAANGFVMATGPTLFFATVGLLYSDSVFGETAFPYEIDGGSGGEWLKRTSNMVFAYHNDPSRFDEDRQKYGFLSREYTHAAGLIDDLMYKSSGYWTMAKSEITFNGSGFPPDVWHPSWTARMRPVHLPGEFSDAGFQMNDAYMQTLPYLALSAQVASVTSSGALDAILNSLRDMAMMHIYTSAMGDSTSGGIAK
ncbi:hypothetical protein FIV42_20150 [Persicimonas caeni]|uniref:Uncharacterized protein n=1 Tax=Persicimonas caeni TaxID=2292766 RepID=A0A4Y6PXB9_PERCE|nr:hypothetical protein [Persicimonas caeni]QDG52972.1 hypothetical protein FIV42_20150 [Persicimonas caeni]QED34194.1 hypothetical protein FRD00_20145 [Persicimonas caeni]